MPPGGWGPPWPRVLELADELTPGSWTLIGGLMVHLHALRAGLDPVRATDDVDVLLHVETPRATWAQIRSELAALDYSLRRSMSATAPEHRFVRGEGDREKVDVLVADHLSPWAISNRASTSDLVRAPGGTSALRKTIDCTLEDDHGRSWLISVPDVLGALTLKGGAYRQDTRDRDRHLEDAVVLCATVSDVDALTRDLSIWTGSDPARVRTLADALASPAHPAWGQLDRVTRLRAQTTLRVLAEGPRP